MYTWLELLRSSLLISLVSLAATHAVPSPATYESELTSLLSVTVSEEGLVDYSRIRNRQADLDEILEKIVTFDGPLDTDDRKKAFWINAYNANMLDIIAHHPGVHNIVDEGYSEEFFKSPIKAAGMELSLDEIEHNILRKQPSDFQQDIPVVNFDPRIHVGLNCAAISCPALAPRAFSAGDIDSMLDDRMRSFVNSERHIRFDGSKLILSSLLDWFGADWDATGIPAGDYLLKYMSPTRTQYDELRQRLAGKTSSELKNSESVTFEYLWFVNDVTFH